MRRTRSQKTERVQCSNKACGQIANREDCDLVAHPKKAGVLVMRCSRCGGQQFFDASPGAKEKPRTGAELIALERLRQKQRHGYTPDGDDRYTRQELIYASIAYQLAALGRGKDAMKWWPWSPGSFKPSVCPDWNLVRAGALTSAEIDRFLRAEAKNAGPEAGAPKGAEVVL
jgi:hypothetical protein